MIVRLNRSSHNSTLQNISSSPSSAIGVEGDVAGAGRLSEAEKLVAEAKRRSEAGESCVGVSGSNSGRGHEPSAWKPADGAAEDAGVVKTMERVVEEEPSLVEGDSEEVEPTVDGVVPGKLNTSRTTTDGASGAVDEEAVTDSPVEAGSPVAAAKESHSEVPLNTGEESQARDADIGVAR
jgi:hypothetical protein